METFVCPKGHGSSEPDYCSECGARMDSVPASMAEAVTTGTQSCPECGAGRDQPGIAFCEICGYNFTTGQPGSDPVMAIPLPPPVPAPPAPEPTEPTEAAKEWEVVVSVDEALRNEASPDAPSLQPVTVALHGPVSLIGRRSQTRAIFPEIDLSYDSAVSARHALLQVDAAGGVTLRDIGAANGTRLNGHEVAPLTDHPLAAGDEITLGHWTRIVLQEAD